MENGGEALNPPYREQKGRRVGIRINLQYGFKDCGFAFLFRFLLSETLLTKSFSLFPVLQSSCLVW